MTDEAKAGPDEALAAVLGKVPSGLFIVTAGDGKGRHTGMLASWVMQAGFEPPSITVAVAAKRYLNDWLADYPHLVVNLLGQSQTDMLKHFGRGFEPDAKAFEGIETTETSCDLPALRDCLGYLEGRVSGSMTCGDHVVYAVELTGASKGSRFDVEKPFVHIRKSGLTY